MSEAFPELRERQSYIEQVIEAEEKRFLKTLDRGLQKLDKTIQKLKSKKNKTISGEDVFLFHDTYGFPYDLTNIIATEHKLDIDYEGYKLCMKEQQESSKKHEAKR